MSREDVASDSLELQGDAQDTNLDLREASPPQDTATAAVQSIEPASDSSDPATQTRKCRVFGSSNTANTLAVLALLVAAIGLSWTICYSFLSQRWTIRNDTLQDCLNFRVRTHRASKPSIDDANLGIASRNCVGALQHNLAARSTLFLAEERLD